VFDAKLGEKVADESNLMQFLGLIEQRANELLQQQELINARATRKWEEEATKLIQQNALSADPKPDFDPANGKRLLVLALAHPLFVYVALRTEFQLGPCS
jgi:hypothetical protein